MATYNVTVQVVEEPEFTRITFLPSSLDFLQAGDVVNFSSSVGTATLSGFSSAFWTSASNITGSGSKTVKSGQSVGTVDYITATASGTSKNLKCTIGQIDETPDPFGLTNKTNIDPKALVFVGSFQVTGINTSVTASLSASGSRAKFFTINYKPRQYTSATVSNGNYISVFAEAEYDYNELSRSVSMTVGTRTETVNIVTRKWPDPEQVIYLGISPPSDLYLKAHVATFFGGETEPHLSDYLRGGGLVPSIEQNEHVPTSLPIYLSDLYDTASALYFTYKPPDKRDTVNTLNGAKTLQLSWNIVNDYNVGYGKLAEYLEYRYTFTSDGSELIDGNPNDVTIHSTSGNPSTWSQNNGAVWLKVTSPQNTERHYKGTITFYCRNAIDNSLVISRTVTWSMFFYGP